MSATLTATIERSLTLSPRLLACQGEMAVALTVNVDTDIRALASGKNAYLYFLLPNGDAFYKGEYDASSGSFGVTLGFTDHVLSYAGEAFVQLVIADDEPSDATEMWKTEMCAFTIAPSISAVLPASYYTVPAVTVPTTFPAENVILGDSSSSLVARNVEDALQELGTSPYYSVKMFGCVGDGVTDDTDAIQAGIDALSAIGGGTLLFPVPTVAYQVAGTITLKRNVSIQGTASYNMLYADCPIIIRHVPTSDDTDLFDLETAPVALGYVSGITIKNISVIGNANSRYAFNLNKPANMLMSNVFVAGMFDEGLHVSYAINSRFEFVNINNVTTCLRMIAPISTTVTFNSCYFHNSVTPVIMEKGSGLGISFNDRCIFESCDNGLDIYTENQVIFNDPYVENIPQKDTATYVFNLGTTGADAGAYSSGTCVINGGDIKGKTGTAGATSGVYNVGKWASLVVSGGRIANFHNSLARTSDAKTTLFLGVFEQQITHALNTTVGALVVGSNYLGTSTAGGWQAWTPTLTGITIGEGTVVARKRTIANSCDFELIITLAADSSITGDINFTLPHKYAQEVPVYGYIFDSDVSQRYDALCFFAATNKCYVRAKSVATYVVQSNCSSTVPMTWATGDAIRVAGHYEYL